MMRSLAGEQVGVLGLARSGLAAARLALARGARVYASDAGDSVAARTGAAEIHALGGDAETGGHDIAKLRECDRIVLSPGISPNAAVLGHPELAAVPIVPELEFAYEQLRCPVICVTGTNGKTTVTSLIAHILARAGRRAPAAGNIGTALSEVALWDPQPEVAVVEASSFQLGRTRTFAPDLGVLTNLAPDHLDWYPGVAEYYADKAKMFSNATPASRWVINGEDAEALALPGDAPGERYLFRIASGPAPGERGGWVDEEGWLTLRMEGDERVLHTSELKILGPHNVANALAASIATRLFGLGPDEVARGLRDFKALEHRMEPVAERHGVLWVNDSKATNIASTRVAIRSLGRPTVLLLGGRHKGEPYTELIPDMQGRVRTVIAFGEAGERICTELGGAVEVKLVGGGFEEVISAAAGAAEPGDAVLLSPACSSYDMFANYEERGRRFKDLALENG
jgi:UDP-N-acetylmuramoylalanine--D-glutamate ligase